MNPFDNQQDAAMNILTQFQLGMNSSLLRADVQSGKTGTYQYLIRMMFATNMIDRAYIVCGSHETELRDQCLRDVREWNSAYERQIKVIFRQDFKKSTMSKRRTLIVVDETHLVCEKDQTLSRFLQRHQVTLGGTTPMMRRDQIYILSVDATPFAELSAIIHNESMGKGRVVLENGPGYFGPQDYYRNGHIRKTFDVRARRGHFINLIQRFPQKYFLIRMNRRNRQFQAMKAAAIEAGADVVYFTSDKSTAENRQIQLSELEHAPERTTIVFIIGKLRCGKRVVKQHIAIAWEGSLGADTDVLLQGLLGRMSGYDVPDVKPLIFLPEKCLVASQNSAVRDPGTDEPLCDLERAFYPDTIPRYASHIVPGTVQRVGRAEDESVRYPCVPVQFQLTAEDIARLPAMASDLHALSDMCLNEFMRTIATLSTANFTEAQRCEIQEKLVIKYTSVDQRYCSMRRLQGNSQASYYNELLDAVKTSTTTHEHVSDCPLVTFFVTFSDYQHQNAVPGQVFAVFYTESKGKFDKVNLESRIPRQDGKTHFTLSPDMRESAAGMVIGFSPAVTEDPKLFEREFDTFIQWSKSGVGRFSRTFVSLRDDQPIIFRNSAYGHHLERFHVIIARLEAKHDIRIMLDMDHSTIYKRVNGKLVGYHGITSISW